MRLIMRRAFGFHSARAALALVMLSTGPINLVRDAASSAEALEVAADTTCAYKDVTGRAAAALDKSMTDFVLDSAAAEAEKVLANRRWFSLDDVQWDRSRELLDAPVESMPRLRRTLTEPTVFDGDA